MHRIRTSSITSERSFPTSILLPEPVPVAFKSQITLSTDWPTYRLLLPQIKTDLALLFDTLREFFG